MTNDGPDLIDSAATRDEVFYGHLFHACAHLYGAKMGFEYLAAASPAPDVKKTYEKADYECEELLVYASSSLLNHFENLKFGWARWQEHGRRVSEIRTAEGAAAAEQQVSQYLDVGHFYPAHYRHALQEGLPAPPETDGTAGGATIGKLCG